MNSPDQTTAVALEQVGTQEIAAVVVTHNRKDLLGECLAALLRQTRLPDRIYVVDNASTDGTTEWLRSQAALANNRMVLIRLERNTGGAGGFHEGMRRAVGERMDWLWVMDDDACPDDDALQALLVSEPDKRHIYGSVAINTDRGGEELCWPAGTAGQGNAFTRKELEPLQAAHNIPFLGLFIHSDLIRTIGLPDKEYFILGDDTEYIERARAHGSNLYLVRDSVVRHPMPARHTFTFMGRRFHNLILPPWKKYYDVRNHILIGRRYYGLRCWTQTLPGVIVRMVDSVIHEPDRLRMLRAYILGILDGILGRRSRRVLPR